MPPSLRASRERNRVFLFFLSLFPFVFCYFKATRLPAREGRGKARCEIRWRAGQTEQGGAAAAAKKRGRQKRQRRFHIPAASHGNAAHGGREQARRASRRPRRDARSLRRQRQPASERGAQRGRRHQLPRHSSSHSKKESSSQRGPLHNHCNLSSFSYSFPPVCSRLVGAPAAAASLSLSAKVLSRCAATVFLKRSLFPSPRPRVESDGTHVPSHCARLVLMPSD